MNLNEFTGLAQALLAEAGDALFLFEPETEQLLAVSTTAESLTRFPREELLRMPASYWFRFGGQGGQQRLRKAATESGIFHAQGGYFLRTSEDGVWIPVSVTLSRLHVKPRTLALLTARDVREQFQTENELKKINAFLDSIVDNIPNMLFLKDADNLRFELFNKAGEELLGYRREDLIGKNDYDFFPPSEADFFIQKDREVLVGKKLVEIAEEEIQTKTGVKFLHTKKIPIIDDKGTPRHLLGISEDITVRKSLEETRQQYARAQQAYARDLEVTNQALRESERRYRQLMEATLDAIVVTDDHGNIVLCNPAAERLFGYPADALSGKPFLCLMPQEHSLLYEKGFRSYLATGQSQVVGHVVEVQGRHRDGTDLPLELALSALDAGGGVQFLAAIRDLTERNRLRTILTQNEKLISIGRLGAGIAHEINNPLALVANDLVVLERDYKALLELIDAYQNTEEPLAEVIPTGRQQLHALAAEIDLPYIRTNLERLFQRTRSGVARVTRIIQSLRGYARMGPSQRQQLHVPNLVDACLEILQDRLRNGNIRVDRDYGTPPTVPGVFTEIQQVLLNLLINACQAIETATGRQGHIAIAMRPHDGELLVEVADNGCGIDPAHRPRLFDPFFTTKDITEGTGLGLWIAHSIVTAHGGRIEVDSEPGQGSRFRVNLPLGNA
jgi:PAS domain S-box-containing protein